MLFGASQAVTAFPETSHFVGVSECPLILACIETLGANSGANQLPPWRTTRAAVAVIKGGDWSKETAPGLRSGAASESARSGAGGERRSGTPPINLGSRFLS